MNRTEMSNGNPRGVEIERYLYAFDGNLRRTMIGEAQQARNELAKSHRGFKVGCAVSVVIKTDYGMEEVKTLSAGNYTPENKKKATEAKWCAERTAINLALAEKGVFILAIVTVSKEVDRGEGGAVHDVLHSCPECRGLLQHLLEEGIMSEETRVCNVNDKDPNGQLIIEEMSLKDFLAKPL